MGFSLKAAACLAACVLSLAAFQAKKGSLEGTVSNALTGAPLKKATVELAGQSISVTTDDKGHYIFNDLDPGHYWLTVKRQGYVTQYGTPSGMVEVATGQNVKNADFKLLPNAAISGKVVDSDGDPVPGVMVVPSKWQYQRGRKQLAPGGTPGQTNEAGEFRIGDLSPGKYFLLAADMTSKMVMTESATAPPVDKPEMLNINSFYPTGGDASNAMAVEVAAGADVQGIKILLAKAKTFRVKGKAANPPHGGMTFLTLTPKDAGIMGMVLANRAMLREDGTFEFKGVTPGSYRLSMVENFISPIGAPQPVEVVDRHISGLMVQGSTPLEVPVTVTIEGNTKDPIKLKNIHVNLEPEEGVMLKPPTGFPAEDGKLLLKDVVRGRYYVEVMNGGVYYTKSVRFNDRDVEEDGIELITPPSGPLQITLSREGAMVGGTVTDGDGKPRGAATVALIPDSHRRSLFRRATSDAAGHYTFDMVPPGDYKVLAWEELENGAYEDPDVLAKSIGQAEAVVLKSGDRKTVKVKAVAK